MRFHTSLPVTNIEATTRFYSLLFGDGPVKTKNDYVKFLPENGGLNVSFHQSDAVGKLTDLHLGFEMKDQASLDETFARLKKEGLVSAERETSICCYANQDKFWVTDPDGYNWEIYLLIEDTETKIEAKSGCCGAGAQVGGACC